MKKYRILCLTDHKSHSKENSLYAIVSKLSQNSRCEEIVVASRSNEKNTTFFFDHKFDSLFATKVDDQFDFESGNEKLMSVNSRILVDDFDIIFLRLPRPVTDDFLYSLESTFPNKLFINKPSGIVRCSNKSVLLNFQNVCPPIKLCTSVDEIIEFSKLQDIVLKPLKEYGGKGLVRIMNGVLNDGKEDHDIYEYLEKIKTIITSEGLMAMKYLTNVKLGDKRLLVVGGEVLAASLRMPAKGSWLCNVSMGGLAQIAVADEDELDIVRVIDPFLSKNGIFIYGVDTLVDDSGKRTLSEINALSIGGFMQAEEQTGKPILQISTNKIFNYADVHFGS